MNSGNLQSGDLYAIAAQTQRTPGFGFGTDSQPVYRQHLQKASIVSRLVASIVDGLLTSFMALLVVIGMVCMDRATGGDVTERASRSPSIATLLIVGGAVLAVDWLYYICQETSGAQATLGKRLMGIKVATPGGGPISVGQSTVRFLIKFGPSIYPLLALVCFVANLLCLATTSQNRALHDLIAGTIVIDD